MARYTILKYILCIALSVLCCQSCYDDKGNYDYADINEISFEGLEEAYTIYTGEPITIKPVFKSTMPGNEADYTYEWVRMGIVIDGRTYTDYVWSDLKEWDNFVPGLPGGTYNFYYRVKDNRTGVTWSSDPFTITIENDITTGFFILSDVNNVGRVDFVGNSRNQWSLKLDILTALGTVNNMPSLENPIGVACYHDENSPRMGAAPEEGQYATVVLTRQGAYRLNPTNFTYEDIYDIRENFLGVLPSGFYAKGIYIENMPSSLGVLLLDNDNNLYFQYSAQAQLWTVGGNCNRLSDGVTRINLAPVIFSIPFGGAVMFDNDKKSFMYKGSNDSYLSYYPEYNEAIFKYNNTGQDLVFLHGRFMESGALFTAYGILNDPATGEYNLASFEYYGSQRSYTKLALADIANAKEFAMTFNVPSTNLYNEFLYYRTDNKIYLYNIADGDNRVVYEAPQGSKISKMKIINFGYLADHMMVFTYDESKPADSCGKLEVMTLRQTYGTLSVTEEDGKKLEWSGFGKVIDADWKNI